MELVQQIKKYQLKKVIFLAIFWIFLIIPILTNAATISRPMHHGGLVGYWDFDSGQGGTTAYDRSGSDNDGTLTNMDTSTDWVDGKFGGGLDFDGTDDLVDLGDNYDFAGGEFTMCTWVKPTNSSNVGYVLGKFDVSTGRGVYLRRASGSPTNWLFSTDDTVNSLTITSGVDLDSWQHICAVIKPTPNTSILYKNGEIGATGSNLLQTVDNSRSMVIGNRYDNLRDFQGVIDDVRFYDRALSANEVKRLYNLGKQKLTSANQTGLVGWWTFDEGDMNLGSPTAEIVDKSGNGNTGDWQNHATTTVTGKLGQAIDFDGTNDFINAGNSTILDLDTNATFAAWIYPKTWGGSNNGNILGRGSNTPSGTGYDFYIKSTGVLALFDGGSNISSTAGSVSLNKWQHAVAVVDGTTVYFYVNGVAAGSASWSLASAGASDNFYIGASSEVEGTYPFDGYIDDVRVYNRALNSEEVATLYKTRAHTFNSSQNNKVTDGLVGLWSFDGPEIAGTTAYDGSSNSNNGTLTNGPIKTIGKIGQALSFDGTDDFITSSISSSLFSSSEVTVSAWVKLDTDSEGVVTFIGTDGSNNDFLQFFYNSSNNRMGVRAKTTVNILYAVGTSPSSQMSLNTWYHVVYVSGTSIGGNKIYVDGVETTLTYTTGTASTVATPNELSVYNNIDIGLQNTASKSSYFDGNIDNVRVYDRVLSKDEIQRLYNLGH